MRPPAKVCGHLALGAVVTDQGRRLARMREALEPIGLGQLLGFLDGGCARHQRRTRQEPPLDLRPRPRRDGVRPLRAIDENAALRLGLRDRHIARPKPLVEGESRFS